MASIEGLEMIEVQTGASSALFGSWRHTSVSRGLDTFDANTTLGFDDDERDYGIAARMLRMLDCTQIVLLTNNPAKLKAASTEPGRRMLDRLRRRPAGVLKQLLDVQRLRAARGDVGTYVVACHPLRLRRLARPGDRCWPLLVGCVRRYRVTL
jgi:hypothetical protein